MSASATLFRFGHRQPAAARYNASEANSKAIPTPLDRWIAAGVAPVISLQFADDFYGVAETQLRME
jgi:hypothetical protein